MLSPETLPEYLAVNLFPLISRTTAKEISSPLILPSEISASRDCPPRPGAEMVPVTFSPSTFNLRVDLRASPPSRPGCDQVQVPEASAALRCAAPTERKAAVATVTKSRRRGFVRCI